ncbi:MAG: hypothetical protein NZ805_12305 [Armatimonadetes bacterium]|nr:hypothetical protein [Armatimonadota bacterium]MDW8029314.1 hypothetical protein [Armatimonadota bacterium]
MVGDFLHKIQEVELWSDKIAVKLGDGFGRLFVYPTKRLQLLKG